MIKSNIKILSIILSLIFSLSANAADFEKIKYKNLKDGSKIQCTNNIWSKKITKKSDVYFIKRIPEGLSKYSEFFSPKGEFIFSTGTQYEFIHEGMLLGYSNTDLKFYEFTINNDIVEQRELLKDEVQSLFPKHKIICTSDFSKGTNSIKIKKGKRNLKIILLNDGDNSFDFYGFSTNNSKLKKYYLKGFIDITQEGMIQFSHLGGNSKNTPWYVLLIR